MDKKYVYWVMQYNSIANIVELPKRNGELESIPTVVMEEISFPGKTEAHEFKFKDYIKRVNGFMSPRERRDYVLAAWRKGNKFPDEWNDKTINQQIIHITPEDYRLLQALKEKPIREKHRVTGIGLPKQIVQPLASKPMRGDVMRKKKVKKSKSKRKCGCK